MVIEESLNTKQLIGKLIVVTLKNGHKVMGELRGFYERNGAMSLTSYTETKEENGKWEVVEEGKFIFLRGDAYWDFRDFKWR